MTARFHRHTRWLAIAAGFLLLTAWLLPSYLSAERFRGQLKAGLEGLFDRPVSFGGTSFRLLPRPGFTLENAVIRENSAFGSEPFARVDRVECDVRWRSLWHRRLEFARLRLEGSSFNVVRNVQGEWNLENLLVRSRAPGGKEPAASNAALESFGIEAEDARLNFKVGADKKPFAVVGLRARMDFDPALGRIRFRFAGNPVRTDLPISPPGILELEGEWGPGSDSSGLVDATLRTRGALLYNWVPLVTGGNPEVYGVINADARIRGSLRVVKVEGEASVAQLHRWELLPPADPMPFNLRFRGEFDRGRKRIFVESFEVSFADSLLHVRGAVDGVPEAPELDLVAALERGRLEDLQALSRRLWRYPETVELSGRVDGLLSIQGRWQDRRYGGFIGAREVRLSTPSTSFPVSELALRIDKGGVRFAPVMVTIAPRIALSIEGAVHPSEPTRTGRKENLPPRYEIRLLAKSVQLRDVVRFGRALGIPSVQPIDAQGIGNATVLLTGVAWPPSRPLLNAKGDFRAARVLIPGLTEPVNIPRARFQVTGDRLVLDPLTAVMGTSVFTGRLEHQGAKSNPWQFALKANALSVEQGAAWFDALGHRPPLPLLARIPGLSSLSARRSAASGLFTSLNARGRFETPLLTYRSLTLQDFQASVELSGRILQLSASSFRAGSGRGLGKVDLDLTKSPASVEGEVTVAGIKLQTIGQRLPPALRKSRGSVSGTARFVTRGLSRSEMSANLEAEGKVQLDKVALGDFDPLQALARYTPWGSLEPARGEVTLRRAEIGFSVRDRAVSVVNQTVELEGARLALLGSWVVNGPLEMDVAADLRTMNRRWMTLAPVTSAPSRQMRVHLAGPFDRIMVSSEAEAAQTTRQKKPAL